MKYLITAAILAASLSGCGGCDGGSDNPDAGPVTFDQCDSDSQAWVRNAYLAIVGHRPYSQGQVDVYVQLLDQLTALKAADEDELLTFDPHDVVARSMMKESGYLEHWTSHFIDALRVARSDEQNMAACYGDRSQSSVTTGPALYVQGNPATAAGTGEFTMLDLVESSLLLDDVTPIYRGHLFALVSYPIPAANVPEVQAELARREDFGQIFDSAYLNRDIVCMQCHNSEFSVTDSSDPDLDRHFPMAGLFEKSLYGDSAGNDHEKAHAVFRFSGFAAGAFGDVGPRRPWGWNLGCGSFYNSVGDDPAAIDGSFAGLTGRRLTVYDLDLAMRTGIEALRGGALSVGTDGTIADPTQSLAYLMAATIVEGVWKEVVGSGLTIANYFPRNAAMRDTLQALTDRFVQSDFSLQDLLVAITSSDYFSRQLPEEGCGSAEYIYPNLYDPWVTTDTDEARRHNGPGDAIAAVSARTLMRTAFSALEWPEQGDLNFPGGGGGGGDPGFCDGNTCTDLQDACNQQGLCCQTYAEQCGGGGGSVDEYAFQQGAGAFLKNGERGFRGLDFQARLVWEDRFGACANPSSSEDDFVDKLVAAAGADTTSTVGDVIAAVKDRLVGEPAVSPEEETTQLAALFGEALDAPASQVTDLESKVRQLCGVLLSSPQFLLSGAAGQGGEVPKLTPAEWQFDAVCTAVIPEVDGGTEFAVSCGGDGTLTVAAP
jgi:hypothetical protein